MAQARVVIEVFAGHKSATPDSALSRRFGITADTWSTYDDRGEILATTTGKALGYAAYLMAHPERVSWVRVEYSYL